MRLDVKKRIFASYVLVLSLGVLLSVLVYGYGKDVLDSSRALVGEDIPQLNDISALQVDILEQEKVLYEYYATHDRQAFLRKYERIDNICVAALDSIARSSTDGREIVRLRARYTELQSLARALDSTLKVPGVDWDRARSLLVRITESARVINTELDDLSARVRAKVNASGRLTEARVGMMQTMVILFAASIFVIALLIGYYVNAYISEYVERRRLAMFPERNPSPVMRLSLHGDVIYANPSTTQHLKDIGADPEKPALLLPHDLPDRLKRLRESPRPHDVCQYGVGNRTYECGIHLLRDLETFHVYVSDITERKRAEEQLVFQAYHDVLTGLPNRRMFQEGIERTLYSTDRGGMRAAILLMGLDRFKVVIGSLGHDFGDALLQAVAVRLEQVLDDSRDVCTDVTLYHFEGDLFAVLIPGFTMSETPILLAERIVAGMQRPLYVSGREIFITFSIGISVFPLDGQDGSTLLKNADTAMHRVKQQGGNAFQCYTQDMNARALEWLSLENHLRHAQELDELRLYYQPQVEIRTGHVVGMEALLRWDHPDRGLILPADIIPLAEETSLILSIGEWILRTACTQNKIWQEEGTEKMTVAVNISARQFHQQNLPQLVAAVLGETDLPPEYLELEITEGLAMRDVEHTVATLHELKRIGVKLSVDDFGTGFSSLSYLKRFPIDKLKVDRSFVRTLATSDNDAAITHAVITLAHSLRLKVVAEGVETPEQLAFLRREKCDEYQGYLFSPPAPADRFAEILRRGSRFRAKRQTA